MMSGVPHHCHNLILFEDILVAFSLQRHFYQCTHVYALAVIDFLVALSIIKKKCINVLFFNVN